MIRKPRATDLLHGFRSGLEDKVSKQLVEEGIPVRYEQMRIEYDRPQTTHKYTPDFELPNGIIIETKGRFMLADRKKHLLIQIQRSDLDIRFVFSNSKSKLSKGSKTTYALWCTKHGFKFADRLIPRAWLEER